MTTELELLQQIARNTSTSETQAIAFISAGAALLGAFIGAFVSFLGILVNRNIELKRLKAGLIAAERLRWLQDIRQRLSSFYSDLDMQFNLLKRPVSDGPKTFQQTMDTYSKSVSEQSNRIILMLNPEKKEQGELRKAINDAQTFFLKCISSKTMAEASFDDDMYASIKTRAFDSLTAIGRQTWKQVKDLQ